MAENSRIKSWTEGVPFEPQARTQLEQVASLPFIYKWVAAMPDVHSGIGTTVGSVIPTEGAVIPAAVGVDIGCGMMAQRLSLKADSLPDSLKPIREAIEAVVPVGFASHKKTPKNAQKSWGQINERFSHLCDKFPFLKKTKTQSQMGTLGGGNHFIELCLDTEDQLWVMLHSGSRGVGNLIGRHFIALAKKDMERYIKNLPAKDLAYFKEGSEHYRDYMEAVGWAQDYARLNRHTMMENILKALQKHLPPFQLTESAVNCHHNYVEKEKHFGKEILVTRKGAVRAGKGELGIIPGSMGAKSFIVQGKGNADSFESCSHGAGRTMSRTQAKQEITVEEHKRSTEGVECRKDKKVLDESPRAYKNIDSVMAAQSDLVEVVHTLKQVVCVKG